MIKDGKNLLKRVESKVTDTIRKATDSKVKQLQTQVEDKTKNIAEEVTKIARHMTRLEKNIIPSENENLWDEIDDPTSRVKDLERKYNSKYCNDANEAIRIIIRNLPERINEDLRKRISNLIKHGHMLSDIAIVSAERKISNSQHKQGATIVTLKEEVDRKKIMANKSALKNPKR